MRRRFACAAKPGNSKARVNKTLIMRILLKLYFGGAGQGVAFFTLARLHLKC